MIQRILAPHLSQVLKMILVLWMTIQSVSGGLASAETIKRISQIQEKGDRPCVALVLGGGGLRGVAQIGIIRVLQRENIPIDLVVGTSMGAIIGGLFCSGVDMQDLQKQIVRRFISAYYPSPLSVQALKMPFMFTLHKRPQGLYSGNQLAKAIDKRLPPEKTEISNLKPKLAVVATDLIEGKTFVITHGDLGKALQASSAIPVLRKPVAFEDALLVDGGTICNLPVREAKELGADFVIAVDVDEKLKRIDRSIFQRKFGGIASRVLGLVLAKLDESAIAEADVCIHPDVTGISLLSKRVSDGELAMAAGEEAAEEALPELKRKLALAGIKTDLLMSASRH